MDALTPRDIPQLAVSRTVHAVAAGVLRPPNRVRTHRNHVAEAHRAAELLAASRAVAARKALIAQLTVSAAQLEQEIVAERRRRFAVAVAEQIISNRKRTP